MRISRGHDHASRTAIRPGNYIPGAVTSVASVGVAVDHPSGWFGGVRFRHFGDAPLIEDGSVRSEPTTLVNLEAGYRIGERLKLSAAVFNVFDSEDNDITYFYESQLPGESAPVEDIHFHPVEPRTVRLHDFDAVLTSELFARECAL